MESRNFQLDAEWNIVHYPYKPTGFGILIIGDERSFVDRESSFWIQNESRLKLINHLKDAGYTIFYSNLYGKNWGSQKAVQLAKQLYFYIIRSEILNEKIHILAEGMGALVAGKLLKDMQQKVRSVAFINPIYSLKQHLEDEKEHKFFYKKLLREIAQAYDLDVKDVEEIFLETDQPAELPSTLPIKIIHLLNGPRSYKQSQISSALAEKAVKGGRTVSVNLILPEKENQLHHYLISFYKNFETEL
jgi:hypothetical protein